MKTDLAAVADLIEICFSDHMDFEGQDYVRQLRSAAEDTSIWSWGPGSMEWVSAPLNGYVWEEDGQVVGNLSLIPYYYRNQWLYLIANVAVLPAYRRRGIARALTEKALNHIKEHKVSSAWLQVRDDNPAAMNLYRSLGFIEKSHRTNWRSGEYASPPSFLSNDFLLQPRQKKDWPKQEAWLRATYPSEVAWYLSFDHNRFNPSFWQSLVRFFSDTRILHWALYHREELIGVASWEPGRCKTDTLWLAADEQWEEYAILALMPHIQQNIVSGKDLMINYPHNRGQEAFKEIKFTPVNNLIWMEVRK